MSRATPSRRIARIGAMGAALCTASCGGGGLRGSAPATEAEWHGLAFPRPTPLPGAARLSLAEIQLLSTPPWPATSAVSPTLGLSELVAVGLLRRADVQFVERRRLVAAAWDDPIPSAAPREYVAAQVPPEALASFLPRLGAEEGWRWEPARVAYQQAERSVGFFEAGVALARTARLRNGGTLGES